MQTKNQISPTRKTLYGIMLLAIFLSTFSAGSLSSVGAHKAAALTTNYILADGQFVYGPNIGDFVIKTYLKVNAPHLLKYADDLYGRSKYFSINPKIYLTLLEIHSHLISTPDAVLMEDPFGLSNGDFISQIEYISDKMSDAYYLHLYTYSAMPVSQRHLDPFVTPSGDAINVAPDTNAGTYAVIAGLAAMDQQNISLILDNSQTNGFYQTYIRLFGNDDPLDETNHIYIPGEVGALAAPDNLLQFPWLQGQSWFFSGVHSNGSGGSGAPFTNAAALDFSPGGISWGSDTSNMWVAASASGIPTKTSNCGFSILHGNGWETGYYHIENIQNFSGTINQNDKIGVIANTLAEAICGGGNASGPHVHFWLSHNGALTAINGTPLSGWYVHAGRWEYDTDPNYMWLERSGIKKYANINRVLSEGSPPIIISGNAGTAGATMSYTDGTAKTVMSLADGSYSFSVSSNWSGLVAPSKVGYIFSPVNRSYLNVISNQTAQNYTAIPIRIISGNAGVAGVTLSYTDAIAKTATSLADGSYSLKVSNNWSGIVTPSHICFTFSLASQSYSNVITNQTAQNYTPTIIPASGCAKINVDIGGVTRGIYGIPPQGSARQNYAGLDSGPVKVMSTDATLIIAAIRDAWAVNGATTSFSELMGLPLEQLSDQYVFPGYNNVTLNDQLRIANVDPLNQSTTVIVTIGGLERGTYLLAAGEAVRINYAGLDSGPVVVKGTTDVKIIAAIREAWSVNGVIKSFVQLMGLPAGQLSNKYVFPAYNNVTLNEQLRIGNVDPNLSTVVAVTIGGVERGTYPLGPGEAVRVNYAGLDSGPVVVEGLPSTVPIISSIRSAWSVNSVITSFAQLMGMPAEQLSDKYLFPAYNNVTLNEQLRISNVDPLLQSSTVTVTVGGVWRGEYPLAAGGAVRINYAGLDSGPVIVEGMPGVKIIAAIREAWSVNGVIQSFTQLMGLPVGQLSTTYLFPAYNNVTLNEQLRFGVP